MNDKDLCFFYFLGPIDVLYFIESDIWINPKGFIPGRRLAIRLGFQFLSQFQTDGILHLIFQRKLIFNWTSVSNISMPYLRKA